MINAALRESVEAILADPTNVIVDHGCVSGHSIEVTYRNTNCSESYCYGADIASRNADAVELVNMLKSKFETINSKQ